MSDFAQARYYQLLHALKTMGSIPAATAQLKKMGPQNKLIAASLGTTPCNSHVPSILIISGVSGYDSIRRADKREANQPWSTMYAGHVFGDLEIDSHVRVTDASGPPISSASVFSSTLYS